MRKKEGLTIGELSKRTGIPVKTLRFYADEGLLPPARRSRAKYRLYDEAQVVCVELVRTLREAGIDLATIREVLARSLSLEDALRLRLAAVEAHRASLACIAAALRAALRGAPSEKDLRRLCTVTRLSNEERKAVITRFYEQVAEGVPMDGEWMRGMIEASSPKLPDDPTPAQLDAWIELAEILADPTFIANMRVMAKVTWSASVDHAALLRAQSEAIAATRAARARGATPDSAEALGIAERFVRASATANGKELDDVFRDQLRKTQDPRTLRYWELVSVMTGEPLSAEYEDGRWLGSAIATFLER